MPASTFESFQIALNKYQIVLIVHVSLVRKCHRDESINQSINDEMDPDVHSSPQSTKAQTIYHEVQG